MIQEMNASQISAAYRDKLRRFHIFADLLFNKFRFFGSRKLYRGLSNFFLPKLNSKIFSPTIYGFDLVVGPDNAYDYYYLGFYEVGALNVFKNVLQQNDVFIDVGANIGLMSFYASQIVGVNGKVISFEPTKKYFEDLTAATEKNDLKNIIPIKKGLGKERGHFPIYFNSVCPSLIKTDDNDSFEIIEIDTLDSVLQENKIEKVKLIKIDVEGFELEVVKGAAKLFTGKDAPVICIEYVRNQQMITDHGKNALDLIKEYNNYHFFQLEKSSDTISKLVEVVNFENLHDNDNVFCLMKNHIVDYKHLIK